MAANCGRCHSCGAAIAPVLDGEEWCDNCQRYQRPEAHGWATADPDSAHCPRAIVLHCLTDSCPLGSMVDWRKCTRCQYYHGTPQFGKVDCGHAAALADEPSVRAERMDAFRASAGVQHILVTGPVR